MLVLSFSLREFVGHYAPFLRRPILSKVPLLELKFILCFAGQN
jgi:hypothetical protein